MGTESITPWRSEVRWVHLIGLENVGRTPGSRKRAQDYKKSIQKTDQEKNEESFSRLIDSNFSFGLFFKMLSEGNAHATFQFCITFSRLSEKDTVEEPLDFVSQNFLNRIGRHKDAKQKRKCAANSPRRLSSNPGYQGPRVRTYDGFRHLLDEPKGRFLGSVELGLPFPLQWNLSLSSWLN